MMEALGEGCFGCRAFWSEPEWWVTVGFLCLPWVVNHKHHAQTWCSKVSLVPEHLWPKSMIDFNIVSSNLRLYVLDTWVKRGASQATDYQFRWEWKPQDRCGKRVVRVNWEGVEDAAVCEAPPAELLLYSCGSLGTSNQNGWCSTHFQRCSRKLRPQGHRCPKGW